MEYKIAKLLDCETSLIVNANSMFAVISRAFTELALKPPVIDYSKWNCLTDPLPG